MTSSASHGLTRGGPSSWRARASRWTPRQRARRQVLRRLAKDLTVTLGHRHRLLLDPAACTVPASGPCTPQRMVLRHATGREDNGVRELGADEWLSLRRLLERIAPSERGGWSLSREGDTVVATPDGPWPEPAPHPGRAAVDTGASTTLIPLGRDATGQLVGWDPERADGHLLALAPRDDHDSGAVDELAAAAVVGASMRGWRIWIACAAAPSPLASFQGWPGVEHLARTPKEAHALLQRHHQEMTTRSDQLAQGVCDVESLTPVLLVCDDTALLLESIAVWLRATSPSLRGQTDPDEVDDEAHPAGDAAAAATTGLLGQDATPHTALTRELERCPESLRRVARRGRAARCYQMLGVAAPLASYVLGDLPGDLWSCSATVGLGAIHPLRARTPLTDEGDWQRDELARSASRARSHDRPPSRPAFLGAGLEAQPFERFHCPVAADLARMQPEDRAIWDLLRYEADHSVSHPARNAQR